MSSTPALSPQQYDRVRDAFLEASALEGESQRAFMRELRGGDRAVSDEVASLLEYDHTRTLVNVRPGDSFSGATLTGEDLRGLPTTAVGADSPTIAVSAPKRPTGRLHVFRRLSRRTGRSLLWSLLGLGLLMAAGYWVLDGVQSQLEKLVADELNVVADARAATLAGWLRDVQAVGETASASEAVRNAVWPLLNREDPPRTAEGLADDPPQDRLAEALAAVVLQDVNRAIARERRVRRRQKARAGTWDSGGFSPDLQLRTVDDVEKDLRYALWTADRRLVASWDRDPAAYATMESDEGSLMLGRVFTGETVVHVPSGRAYLRDYEFKKRPEVAVTAPIFGDDGRVAAAVLVGGIFQESYEEVLLAGEFKQTGETYAVLPGGVMASQGRFGGDLAAAGLIGSADEPTAAGLRVLDPGRDLTATGERLDGQPADWLLTRSAAAVLGGRDGSQTEPYRDYRGVPVVGAWRWLPEFELGLVAEIDRDEAMAPVDSLRGLTRRTFALLTLAALVSAVLSARAVAQAPARPDKRVGAYTLHGLLGEGGMGRVYRAEHDLLLRPAAVKILKPDVASPEMTARFEREVRLASSLNSPHTIEVYDFGRTGEGEADGFYCAMELLDGLTLRQLIRLHGPQPPARVAYLLKQVCRSLSEAHIRGLVHRDIKPANIMLSDRGGTPDHVTVLDFGLAKERASTRPQDSNVTKTSMLLGTPEFIAPERIRHPGLIDPRSDLYAVGVVAYLMLTGQSVFETTSELETLERTLYSDPPPPSQRRPEAGVPPALDAAVLTCLKKDPEARPDSASRLLTRLNEIEFGRPWGEREARAWWDAHA